MSSTRVVENMQSLARAVDRNLRRWFHKETILRKKKLTGLQELPAMLEKSSTAPN
jgi:hypothetical protein